MERNLSFDTEAFQKINARLAWAQMEALAADVEKVQVLAAGDEVSVSDLRIELKDGTLEIEQPQYGLSRNIIDSHWLQICLRLPQSWSGSVRCSTISGLLSARKLNGTDLSLETVTGDIRLLGSKANTIAMKTISGDLRGEALTANTITVRSVSGNCSFEELCAKRLKCSSISGEQNYSMTAAFEKVDVTAVSGNVTITAPVDELNVNLRSVSGQVRTKGINIIEDEDKPSVQVTGVSADLKLIGLANTFSTSREDGYQHGEE